MAEQRIRAVNAATTVDLRLAPVPPIPFDDAAFDAAFMAFTLELFPDDTIPRAPVTQPLQAVSRQI